MRSLASVSSSMANVELQNG